MGRLWAIFFLFAMQSQAQGPAWQLGGSGSAWSRSDSLQVLIDFDSTPESAGKLAVLARALRL